MTDNDNETQTPIDPVYPPNEPSEEILLYSGVMKANSTAEAMGEIKFIFSPEPRIAWNLERRLLHTQPGDDLDLSITPQGGHAEFPAMLGGIDQWNDRPHGHANSITVGDAEAPLKRIVAHWFNLPSIPFPTELTKVDDEGCKRTWSGRWQFVASDWMITFDARPDHISVWQEMDKSHVYVMTHVMEIRKADGSTFTANEAEPVLSALHTGISFAWGRWVAPMLPVGMNEDDEIVWQEWQSLHCDRAKNSTSGWWYHRDRDSLESLCKLLIAEFLDSERFKSRRIQLMMAIAAINDTGFTEQRIVMGTAGIEHITWQELRLSKRLTRSEYKAKDANECLRILLTDAKVLYAVDATILPSAASFIASTSDVQNGADLVPRIRNRIVHPKGSQDVVYDDRQLLREVWLLTRHYLTLLILRSLGYEGKYRDMTKMTGWVGDIETVPWAR